MRSLSVSYVPPLQPPKPAVSTAAWLDKLLAPRKVSERQRLLLLTLLPALGFLVVFLLRHTAVQPPVVTSSDVFEATLT